MCSDQEKNIRIEKNLELRNLLFDKVLVGLIVGAVVFAAAKNMESFKNSLAHERFLAEAKWSALEDLRDIHSKLAQAMYFDISNDIGEDDDFIKNYAHHIGMFATQWNKMSVLFDVAMDGEIQKIITLHEAVVFRHIDLTEEHRGFVIKIGERFEYLTRNALGEEILGRNQMAEDEIFAFTNSNLKEDLEKNPGQVFTENWEKYKIDFES